MVENSVSHARHPYDVVDDLFKSGVPTIPEVADSQRRVLLADGTEMIVAKYDFRRSDRPPLGAFAINISPQNMEGVTMEITEDGLSRIEIGERMVTLNSVISPRPGENFLLIHNGKSLQTPAEYLTAAEPLAKWASDLISESKYFPPPVEIVEKDIE